MNNPIAVTLVSKQANRELEKALMHTEPEIKEKVVVRKEIGLYGDPVTLCDLITEFLIMCRYDEEARYKIENNIMYLEGSRPLLASEVIDVQKGLFED